MRRLSIGCGDFYSVRTIEVRALTPPLRVPEGGWASELFRGCTVGKAVIWIWTRMAIRKQVTSCGTFLSVLYHEFCHHLDCERLGTLILMSPDLQLTRLLRRLVCQKLVRIPYCQRTIETLNEKAAEHPSSQPKLRFTLTWIGPDFYVSQGNWSCVVPCRLPFVCPGQYAACLPSDSSRTWSAGPSCGVALCNPFWPFTTSMSSTATLPDGSV